MNARIFACINNLAGVPGITQNTLLRNNFKTGKNVLTGHKKGGAF